jgi:hypothetical protein
MPYANFAYVTYAYKTSLLLNCLKTEGFNTKLLLAWTFGPHSCKAIARPKPHIMTPLKAFKHALLDADHQPHLLITSTLRAPCKLPAQHASSQQGITTPAARTLTNTPAADIPCA